MIQTTIGDAVIELTKIPSASVDAVITDPPYCSGSVSEAGRAAAKGQGLRRENIARFGWFVGDNMGTAGLSYLLREVAIQSLRILKPTGSLLMFCDWRQAPNVIPAVESVGFRYQNLIVWDKTHMGLGNGFRARHELIMHMTAGAPEYHNRGTANVLQAKRVHASERSHQTQKPVDLMRQLIRTVCPPGGTVADPFMGAGSTGVAALEEGCCFIGIERDPDHYATAMERMRSVIPPNSRMPGAVRPGDAGVEKNYGRL